MSGLHFIISSDMKALRIAFLKIFQKSLVTEVREKPTSIGNPFAKEWVLTEGPVSIEMLKRWIAEHSFEAISSGIEFPYLENWVEKLESILQIPPHVEAANNPINSKTVKASLHSRLNKENSNLNPSVPSHSEAIQKSFRETPYAPETMQWILMRIFTQLLKGTLGQDNPVLVPLIAYLKRLQTLEARSHFASALARVFDRYTLSRVDWLAYWERATPTTNLKEPITLPPTVMASPLLTSPPLFQGVYGEIAAWQRWLWRRMSSLLEGEHKVQRLDKIATYIETLPKNILKKQIPRLFLFNFSILHPHYRRLINALAQKTDVYFFKWDFAATSETIKFLMRPRRHQGTEQPNEAYAFSNTLGLGKRRDDFLQILQMYFYNPLSHQTMPAPNNASPLDNVRIQQTSFEAVNPTLPTVRVPVLKTSQPPSKHSLNLFQKVICKPTRAAVADFITCLNHEYTQAEHSLPPQAEIRQEHNHAKQTLPTAFYKRIVFYSTHHRYREVEMLHERLVALFLNDPTLKPSDVCIVAPNIELYEPFIRRIFTRTSFFFYTLPRKSHSRQEAKDSLTLFIDLLELLGRPKWTVEDFDNFLGLDFIGERYTDLEFKALKKAIHAFFRTSTLVGNQTGAAIDLGKMIQYLRGLFEKYGQNEIFAGKTLRYFLDPEQVLTSDEKFNLGSWFRLFASIKEFQTSFLTHHSLREWKAQFFMIGNDFFEAEFVATIINQGIKTFFEKIFRAGAFIEQDMYPLEFMIIALKQAWLTPVQGTGLPTINGGIVCASMLQMRGFPVKVMCLLGMDKASFPRDSGHEDFDLTRHASRITDRDPEADDELLFLELISTPTTALFLSFSHEEVPITDATQMLERCYERYDNFMSLLTQPMRRLLYVIAEQLNKAQLPLAPWLAEHVHSNKPKEQDTPLYRIWTYLYEDPEEVERTFPIRLTNLNSLTQTSLQTSQPRSTASEGKVDFIQSVKYELSQLLKKTDTSIWVSNSSQVEPHTTSSGKTQYRSDAVRDLQLFSRTLRLLSTADLYFLQALYVTYADTLNERKDVTGDTSLFSPTLNFAKQTLFLEFSGKRSLAQSLSDTRIEQPLHHEQAAQDPQAMLPSLALQTLRIFFEHPLKWYLHTHFKISHQALELPPLTRTLETSRDPVIALTSLAHVQFIEAQLREQFKQQRLERTGNARALPSSTLDPSEVASETNSFHHYQRLLLFERWEFLWEQIFRVLSEILQAHAAQKQKHSLLEIPPPTTLALGHYTGTTRLSTHMLQGTVTNIVANVGAVGAMAGKKATYEKTTKPIRSLFETTSTNKFSIEPTLLVHVMYHKPTLKHWILWFLEACMLSAGVSEPVAEPIAKSEKQGSPKGLDDFRGALFCALDSKASISKSQLRLYRLKPLSQASAQQVLEWIIQWHTYGQRVPLPLFKSGTTKIMDTFFETKNNSSGTNEPLGEHFYESMLEHALAEWETQDSQPTMPSMPNPIPNRDYELNNFFFTDLSGQKTSHHPFEQNLSKLISETTQAYEARPSRELEILHIQTTYHYFYKILALLKPYLERYPVTT